jgi:hypothetical protein
MKELEKGKKSVVPIKPAPVKKGFSVIESLSFKKLKKGVVSSAKEKLLEKKKRADLLKLYKEVEQGIVTKAEDFILKAKSADKMINFKDPLVITKLAGSKLPFIRSVGAKFAVESKDEKLEALYADSTDEVVLEEMSLTTNLKTALAIAENPKSTNKTLAALSVNVLKKLWYKDRELGIKVVCAIINHQNVDVDTLESIVFMTFNSQILLAILNCDKLTSGLVSTVLSRHFSNGTITLAAIKSYKANRNHLVFAAQKSKSKMVIKYLAKSYQISVLESLARLNKGKDLLLKNRRVTVKAISYLVYANIRDVQFLKKVLLHPKVRKNYSLWHHVMATTRNKELIELCVSCNNSELKLVVARLFAHLISDKIFKILLNDSDKRISEALKQHTNEEVRVRASMFTTDNNYLMDRVSQDDSIKVKVAIARRNNIKPKTELALLEKRSKPVYLALAKKKGEITTVSEETLAGTGDIDILLALSSRSLLRSDLALEKLAKCGIAQVELKVIKKYKQLKVQNLIAFRSTSVEVLKYILQKGHVEARKQIASRDYTENAELLKALVLEIIKDSQSGVKVALFRNLTFLEKLWTILKDPKKQVGDNPYFAAFKKLKNDGSEIVRKRITKMIDKLSTTQKADIKKWSEVMTEGPE